MLKDSEFAAIADLARRNFGLDLQPAKRPLVYSRLSRRLRALKLGSFSQYLSLLDKPGSEVEQMEMLSALTTNVTHFFREDHHFEQFRKEVLPNAIARAKQGGRVRFWSAGCSAGQEPYSIAFSLLDAMPDAADYDIKILATDVDPTILARARQGDYGEDEIQSLKDRFRKQYTCRATGERYAISGAVKELISFAELNLVREWPISGPFQAIFCRNVAIYFGKDTQMQLWSRFVPVLEPGALLFIGHSERITGPASSDLQSAGITSYRRSSTKQVTR
ncbi:CheR family methyltransferase [Pelagovum pacificum]|nr:protein-glutamate O-methyltransferase CheR [Pelagovum pacificum]